MSVKAWNAKVIVDNEKLRAILGHNLRVWNEGCKDICLTLLAFRRGDNGVEGQDAWKYVAEKSGNYHLIYWLTESAPKALGKSEDVQRKLRLAQAFLAANGGPENRLLSARSVLGCLWLQAIKASIERVKSYEAKLDDWRNDHDLWLAKRATWEYEHSDYMKLRPLVEHFQSEAGATRGSRSRWLKWLNFLRSTPEIVCWRDPKAEYEPLTDAEVKKVRQSRRRAVSRERDLVFAKNPTLAEFDRSHGLYEREFARTYAKRRHSDGFRQRPTFTLPSLPTRPDWPRFQQAQGWQKLDLIAKSLELRLLDEDGGNSWINLRMVPDPRIASITRLDEAVKIRRVKYEYKWRGKCSETTLIQPQGAKLICKPSGMFLSISFDIQPPPCLIPYDQAAVTKYGFRSTLRKTRESAPDSTLITCAVDLAIRHLGALSIAREGEVFARRILKNRTSLPGTDTCVNIPALADIAQLKRRLRTARRKSGKISPNKHSCRRLQEHYRNMQADRYKKAAAVICQYARLHGAQVLIFEDLKRLVPDTANERGVNNALASWNQGSIIDSAKKTAEDFGLRVVTVPAYYTSRLCARCNAVGVRYDQGRKRPFRTPRRVFHVSESHRRAVEITALGHWFYCPNCQRRVHADLNASENLHKVFLGTFPYAKRDGRDFIVVDDKRLDLRETRIEAERQLKIATFGKLPF